MHRVGKEGPRGEGGRRENIGASWERRGRWNLGGGQGHLDKRPGTNWSSGSQGNWGWG